MKPHITADAIARCKEIVTVERLEFFYHCGLLSGLLSPGDSWRCVIDHSGKVLSFEAVPTADVVAAVRALLDDDIHYSDGCFCVAQLNENDEAVNHRIAEFPKCELDQRMTAVAG